jgi:hypothetical protein
MMPRIQPAMIGMAQAVEGAAVYGVESRGRHERSPLVATKIDTRIAP